MKHWRTTLGGFTAGIGIILLGIAVLREPTYMTPVWVMYCGRIGLLCVALGVTFLGYHASDHKAQ